jgi:hypothetical protein
VVILASVVLTTTELQRFDELGFLWLRGVFNADQGAAMRAVVWRELARRYGIQEEEPATWSPTRPSGLKNSKRHRAFDPIGGSAVAEAADSLLGAGCWSMPRQWGPVLVTFPFPGEPWVLPHRVWHVDLRYDNRAEPLFGLKLFALFGDAGPQGGGTLLVSRSHHLVARFVGTQPDEVRSDFRRTRLRFMSHHPVLKELARPGPEPARRERFMDHDHDVDGIAIQVIELTGQAGDVVLTHPWALHHVAPNASMQPRFMRAQSIYRSAALPERLSPVVREASLSSRSGRH